VIADRVDGKSLPYKQLPPDKTHYKMWRVFLIENERVTESVTGVWSGTGGIGFVSHEWHQRLLHGVARAS
jgi:hypothetical protein